MRNLIFIFALLCCSTQAMAADPCLALQGKSLTLDANGYHATVGPNGINLVNQNNTLTFKTTANFTNEPVDPVQGQCKDRHITFTRTRAGSFVQDYDGWIFEKELAQMAGTYSNNGQAASRGWLAKMSSVPPANNQACLNACGVGQTDCMGTAHSTAEKQGCVKDYTACKACCADPTKCD
ncbi:MAG: hypothetical protein ACJ76Y_30070 [Thermoanaerobaculia bacterium]